MTTTTSQSVLVLGAGGYLGEAVTRGLLARGHAVHVVVRDGDGADLPSGAVVHAGDATDPQVLARVVTDDVAAVVNLLPPAAGEVDLAVSRTLVDLLATRQGRSYVYGSGAWVLGATPAGEVADESTPARPLPIVAHRPAVEDVVLAASARGVRGIVVRPGVVHGDGRGIPALLVDLAARKGYGVFVGEQPARWPMVHRDDLAELVALLLEAAPAEGGVYHAVAEPAVDTAELARAAARAAGVADEARGWPFEEAAAELGGAFAEALACDQDVAATRARALGWRPRRPGAVADLAASVVPVS